MKHLLSTFVAILSVMFTYSSCSNHDDTVNNPLAGTLWSFDDEVTVFEKNEFTRYIEFVDDNAVKVWDTDTGNVYTGTYTYEGYNVTFSNLHDAYWDRYYIGATFTSKSLTISFSHDEDYKTGPYFETYTRE